MPKFYFAMDDGADGVPFEGDFEFASSAVALKEAAVSLAALLKDEAEDPRDSVRQITVSDSGHQRLFSVEVRMTITGR